VSFVRQALLEGGAVGEKPEVRALVGFVDEVAQGGAGFDVFRDVTEDDQAQAVVGEFLNDLAGEARAQDEEVAAEARDGDNDSARLLAERIADQRACVAIGVQLVAALAFQDAVAVQIVGCRGHLFSPMMVVRFSYRCRAIFDSGACFHLHLKMPIFVARARKLFYLCYKSPGPTAVAFFAPLS
jgi:hypothetical protein